MLHWKMQKIRSTSTLEDDKEPRSIDLVLRYVCLVAVFVSRLFVMSLIAYNMVYETETVEAQTCQCSSIPASTYITKGEAASAILDTGTRVRCDADGAQDCKVICSWMVQTSPSVYWKKTCANQKNYKEYKALVFYRPCSESIWHLALEQMTVYCIGGEAY